jgi:hypothetical protein
MESNSISKSEFVLAFTGPPNNATDGSSTTGDPLFVNAAARDIHIRQGSPAVGSGVPLADVPRDEDGVPRPAGSGFDLGAYEFVPWCSRPQIRASRYFCGVALK